MDETYISVGKLVRFAREQKVKETGAYSKGLNNGLGIIISAVRDGHTVPPADVHPTVLGEWRGEYLECSICGRSMSELIDAWSYFGNGMEDVRFCPWCGADMRHKKEATDG